MESLSNIPCSALTDALTALATNTQPGKRNSTVKTIPRAQHTSYLTDTADAVREVARKMGKTRLKWDNPKSVMIITKPGDCSLIKMTRDMALYLIEMPREDNCGITCFVDEKLKNSKRFKYDKIIKNHPKAQDKLKFWTPELCALQPKSFDFIITLGGDGTVLFSSWLFQNYIPPVIPFHLGSLGFLTPFDFDRYKLHLHNAIDRGVRINLRGRLTCTVYRRVLHSDCKSPEEAKSIPLRNVVRDPVTGKISIGGWCQEIKKHRQKKKKFGEVDGDDIDEEEERWLASQDLSNQQQQPDAILIGEHRQVPCYTTIPVEKYHVINDLVVDRGPSPYVSLLELFGDDKHLTTVQADGLAISTPTGSTAYSLSAGGSLTHPDIQAILITPICPHTLSFRPTLVPDSMELRICVPFNSRNTAWASFDGRGRIELKQGDHIKVTASRYPFPTVCKEDQATDWFNSLQNCLHWNKRERQKSFAVVESHAARNQSKTSFSSTASRNSSFTQLSQSPKTTTTTNTFPLPVRSDTQSPPYNTTTQSTQRKSSATSSVVSSSSDHDQIFGYFEDDDDSNSCDHYHTGIGNNGRRRSSVHHYHHPPETSSSSSSISFESTDEFESDDESDFYEDGFKGWTDEEIVKSRYMANITKELEKVSIKYTNKFEIPE
ncbi:ATP-NAD kinase-like domain-containing protein [Cokeromyces recurvatus]|uniref:ATP-NAD kinase-like domain-containing protein n=1 Tax=Cokeromyces recurvatus TaxID=90255 RepID=UPI00221F957F|nr:ATP-NAD kinase-like domain-containing protein [Cokeromyces recurvatus]KAI7905766.1 ATP-NAD kinase-like domain-containing protein [Cokeromyces recurvatus]